jgi:hypothetical protein
VSVDLVAELPARVSLAAALEQARDVLRTLLSLDSEPPELAVSNGWRVENHWVSSGRLLSPRDLANTVIGQRIPRGDGQDGEIVWGGYVTFFVDLAGGRDRALVRVCDFTGLERGTKFSTELGIEMIVSPTRTCVGVVLGTAIAVGAASASGGDFIDMEIHMLDEASWDPGEFIELARLTDGAGDFAARCEQFMRQFPCLDGWPKRRSDREA